MFDRLGGKEEVNPEQLGLEPPELDFHSPEVRLLVSVGTSAEVGGATALVSGRYWLGLTEVSSGDGTSGLQGLGLGANRGFSVTAGVAF